MEPPNVQRVRKILEQKQIIQSLTPEEISEAKKRLETLLKNINSRNADLAETKKFLALFGIAYVPPANPKEQKDLNDLLLDIYSEILKRQNKSGR